MSKKADNFKMENISSGTLKKLYITMLKIRKIEERIGDLVSKKEVTTPCHLYIGQEAIATGVCTALKVTDWVFSTHRSHGHYIAKGGGLKELMAEIYCRKTGCSGGKGGSMHIASPDVGLSGSSAIVGGTIPLAVGAALTFSLKKNTNVSVAFFGDGAVGEGVFYESLNFASLKKLPVIFVCENNFYSTHMHISKCLADTDISKKAKAFNIPSFQVNGNDAIKVFKTAKKAIEFARKGGGPAFLECLTYRWRGHVGPNLDLDKGLRTKKELDRWMRKCPIKMLGKFLIKEKILSKSEKKKISKNIEKEIKKSIVFAQKSPYPGENELLEDVFKSK